MSRAIATATLRLPSVSKCKRCGAFADRPEVTVIWYADQVSQYWRCSCGHHNPTNLTVESLPI